MARLFFMGLWNECDDYGSFEWAPLKLKMRLLPGDNADANELLSELIEAGSVLKYEVGGKAYGAVRNFCQYQRPKKPNSTFPQTAAVRQWVNIEARSSRDGSEAVPDEFPTSSEIPRQRKEEGGRMEEIEEESSNEDLSIETDPPPLSKSEILEAWHDRMVPLGFPAVRKMTAQRERQLAARLKDSTLEEWQRAMDALERSDFCRGKNDRGWRADFDFLLQPKSFTKLLEGAYDR
jgi:hypothetical protein